MLSRASVSSPSISASIVTNAPTPMMMPSTERKVWKKLERRLRKASTKAVRMAVSMDAV